MSEPTNAERAERAYRLVLIYNQCTGDDDIEAGIYDLSTDLLHLCDEYGIEQDDAQRIARHHYNAEKHEEVVTA